MNLLPGEKVLLQSDTGNLVLTSHRVRYTMQTAGLAKLTSIMLEELSACEITRTAKPWLLVLASIVFLAGIFKAALDSSAMIGGTIIAGLLILTYFGTREAVISLRSANAAINAPIHGMNAETATNFIDAVETAKNARFFAVGRAAGTSA